MRKMRLLLVYADGRTEWHVDWEGGAYWLLVDHHTPGKTPLYFKGEIARDGDVETGPAVWVYVQRPASEFTDWPVRPDPLNFATMSVKPRPPPSAPEDPGTAAAPHRRP